MDDELNQDLEQEVSVDEQLAAQVQDTPQLTMQDLAASMTEAVRAGFESAVVPREAPAPSVSVETLRQKAAEAAERLDIVESRKWDRMADRMERDQEMSELRGQVTELRSNLARERTVSQHADVIKSQAARAEMNSLLSDIDPSILMSNDPKTQKMLRAMAAGLEVLHGEKKVTAPMGADLGGGGSRGAGPDWSEVDQFIKGTSMTREEGAALMKSAGW